MNLEITIPVLNEEETIREKIKEMIEYTQKNILNKNVSFIIADNGSTDKTEQYSMELIKKYNNLKYIKLPEKGVGLALRTSWSESKADYVGYMDLDIATDLKALLTVIDELEKGTKIVNGSRLLKESEVINRTLLREITSRGFNLLLKLILKIKFTDDEFVVYLGKIELDTGEIIKLPPLRFKKYVYITKGSILNTINPNGKFDQYYNTVEEYKKNGWKEE